MVTSDAWRFRHDLPHFDAPGVVQMITCRLHEAHLRTAIRYIDENPVRAGLVANPESRQFGSAERNAADLGVAW